MSNTIIKCGKFRMSHLTTLILYAGSPKPISHKELPLTDQGQLETK